MPETKLPYQNLLDLASLSPTDRYNDTNIVSARFLTWVNNQTRLNATNMNELVAFIQAYSRQIGVATDEVLSSLISEFIEQNAGWKVTKDTVNSDGSITVNNGELFNNYIDNRAEGKYGHAEGDGTNAFAESSHAQNIKTTASGRGSTSTGIITSAEGEASFTGGIHTHANKLAQFVIGMYNKDDEEEEDTLFQIGNGDEETLSNAFEVHKDGHVEVSNLNPPNQNSLTTRYYVDESSKVLEGKINQEIQDRQDADDKINTEIEKLKLSNEYIGAISVTESQYNDPDVMSALLDAKVEEIESRSVREGDLINITLTEDDGDIRQEMWLYTPTSWKFYSALQPLVDATKTNKGVVSIGDGISVSNGVISVDTNQYWTDW